MVFTNKQKENPEASAALTHAVLDQELFKLCFEQVAVSRISGKRPSVEVYALCKGSCNMTAEDRRKHPGRSSRPRESGAFEPAKCLTEALKDLVSKHKDCFQPQLTWELLSSSWAVAGPSASHATTEPPVSQPSEPPAVLFNGGAAPVPPGDGCGDTSTAMTEQEARVVEDAVMPPNTSDDSEMPNTEQQSQARPHLGGRLLRLISASWCDAQVNEPFTSPPPRMKHPISSPAASSDPKRSKSSSPASPGLLSSPASPGLLANFSRMQAKEKDTVIESLRQEIKNLTSTKLTLERKVQALRDFIGGSDPTANASKRRSYADKAKLIVNYTDPKQREAILVRAANETPHRELQERTVREHQRTWIHDEHTGLLGWLRYHAEGSRRRTIYVLEDLIQALEQECGLDGVFAELSLRCGEGVSAEKYICNRVRGALDMLSRSSTNEARQQSRIILAAVAPEVAQKGDSTGMSKKVCDVLGLTQHNDARYKKWSEAKRTRSEADAAARMRAPFEVGDAVASSHGTGKILEKSTATQALIVQFESPDGVSSQHTFDLNGKAPGDRLRRPFVVGQPVRCVHGDGKLVAVRGDGRVVVEVIVDAEHNEVQRFEYSNAGWKKGGARLIHPPPDLDSFTAVKRPMDKTIVVALDDFIKVLTASADRLVESPCKSDVLNKRKRRGVVIQHQLVVMFGRMRDLFDDWHRTYPQYVAKLGFSKFKVLVRTRHWYIRSVQRENCCCLPCENHAMTRKPMTKAAETMEQLVAQMEAGDDSGDANADDDGDTASAKDKETMLLGLKDLIKLCRMKHKLDQMQFILCDPLTPDCLDDKCERCGFKRLWSNGLRPLLVDGNELKSTPAALAFGAAEVKLEKYVKISAERKKDYSKQADAKDDQSSDYGKKDGAKKRLDTEASIVNLAELLDYFETICPGMCKHRHTLKECKEAAQELFRNAPLGYFLLDKDFAENFLIIAARLIQSQYWSQISATLYIVVLRWLCAKTWHDTTTTLKPGDEVTVDAPAADGTPFWARVQLALDGDVYRLECADGKVVEVERSRMHQRKWLSHAFPCFSDDMRHDSFLAQHLDNKVLEYIKTEIIDVAHTDVAEPSEWMDERVFRSTSIRVAAGDEVTVQPGNGQEAFRATVVELKQGGKVTVEDKFGQKTVHGRELLRKIEYKVVICMHSDNASQHFKTVKALHWLSHLKERFPWLRTVRWCFGCPGHGKGPWDGIGAVIKSLLRLAITYNQCANPAGKISTALHCYEHVCTTLCGPSWQPGRGAAITKFVTFYATNHEVDSQTRHVNRYELSQCPGIMSSYSYFALEKDVVLQRRFDCNCHACLRATYPHEDESVDPMIDCDGKYVIRGCLRGADSFHEYEDRCVRRLDNQAEQALRKASEKVGNELAKEWNAKRMGAGQYLLVQNGDPTADGHQLWCCRTVDCTRYEPRSADMGMDYGGCVLHIATKKTKMPNSVGLAVGEHAITVQWCERDPSAADDRKLTFVYDPTAEVTVINASEIRLELSGADEPKVLAAPKRVTRPRPRPSHVAAVQPNAQQQQQAEAQRKAAQTVFSVHTRSELEALKLCHHLTL